MSRPCATPLEERLLVDYWLADIHPSQAESVEGHLFECSQCTERLHALARVIDGTRDIHRTAPPPIVSRTVLDSMMKQGARVQEVSVTPYGEFRQRLRDDVDLCVVRVLLDLQAVEALDLEYLRPDGTAFVTVNGVPFEHDTDEVLLACERHVAAAHHAIRFRLTGVSAGVRRELADFVCVNADAAAGA